MFARARKTGTTRQMHCCVIRHIGYKHKKSSLQQEKSPRPTTILHCPMLGITGVEQGEMDKKVKNINDAHLYKNKYYT